MTTFVLDEDHPDPEVIRAAAARLEGGGLVAFPTETVYGLGASAWRPEAVQAVYEAKGRAFTNPLALHSPDLERALRFVRDPPRDMLQRLESLLPGPLMLVLWRVEDMPAEAFGGGATIGIRIPSHPVARALLAGCEHPIVATSANRSGRPTATRAQDVASDLEDRIDLLLGTSRPLLGLESTVLDLTQDPPVVLRPGAIGRDQLQALLGVMPVLASAPGGPSRSPQRILVVEGPFSRVVAALRERSPGSAILATDETVAQLEDLPHLHRLGPRDDPDVIARNLFAAIRDSRDHEVVLIEGLPQHEALSHRLHQIASEIVDLTE